MSNYFQEKELLEKRAAVITEQEALLEAAESEGRDLTPEEEKQFDDMEEDYKTLTKRIERVRQFNERQKGLDEKAEAKADRASYQTGDKVVPDQVKEEEERQNEVFWKAVRSKSMGRGLSDLDSEEKQIFAEFRAQSAGTNSEGGFTVPQGFSNELYESMKAFGGARELARIITTATGNQIDWPTEDDTSNTGALLGENTQVSEQDVVFANKTLDAYKYTSKLIRVSRELIQDSAFDMSSHLSDVLGTRLGRITNTHYTTGTGSSQPQGFTHAASLGKTTASGTAFTRAEVIDLIHSVDPAYRRMGNAAHQFSDATLAEVKKLEVGSSDARPLWQPSMRVGEPDLIEGFPYVVNQDIDDANTAGNQFWFFGDWSAFIIRDVLDITLLILTERYADYFQTGFVAFMRTDSELLDSSAIKYMRNTTS